MKGNYPRVHAAMSELKSLASSLKVRQTPHAGSSYRGCVLKGFQESLAQFQRFSQNFRQVSEKINVRGRGQIIKPALELPTCIIGDQ